MRCHAKRREWWGVWVLVFVCVCGVGLTGCGSPPSVLPLLTAAEEAARAEAARFEADVEREAQWIEQARAALERAYERDLAAQEELSRAWIVEATRAYVAAREELVRHEMQRREQLAQRRENLHAVAAATQQAAAVLQEQDELMTRVIGGRAWDLLRDDGRQRARDRGTQ